MEKKKINLEEVSNVDNSLKELSFMYCEELDIKKKDLDSIANQRKELEAYISYLENNQHSDVFVFSPRGVVNRSSASEDKVENNKVVDFSEKQKKQEELNSIQEKEIYLQKEIALLQKKISLLEQNHTIMEEFTQYYKDTVDVDEVTSPKSNDIFLDIYEADYKNLKKHIQEESIQSLSYLYHIAHLCENYMDNDPVRAKLEMNNIQKTIQEVIDQLREFVDEFLPYVTEANRYSLALNQILVRVKRNCPNLEINLKVDEMDKNENRFYCFLLLKIIMEYSLNVSKHASATKMSIEFYNHTKEYEFIISDNGTGFDYYAALEKENCNGLKIAKNLIQFLNGKLDFKSMEKKGTNISVIVPKGEL